MKRNSTSLLFLAKQMVGKAVLAVLFFALFGASAFGQISNLKDDVGDLSAVKWKSQADLSQTIVQEQARVDAMLAPPDLQLPDRSLFMSYHRLLGYINTDVQGGMPVDEAITNNYVKVVTEAESDPTLKELPPGVLRTYLPGLIEALAEVPVPGQ